MKDRFSGGGGESACSSLLVEAAAPDDDDAGEPAASADETSALDAVRLMPFPLHATVVAECIYYNTLTSKLISSISFSITLSLFLFYYLFTYFFSLIFGLLFGTFFSLERCFLCCCSTQYASNFSHLLIFYLFDDEYLEFYIFLLKESVFIYVYILFL